MYFSKDYRGHGITKGLIDILIERVKLILDFEQINLTVISNNENAKKPYEKFSFVTLGSEQNAIKWKRKYLIEDQIILKL